MKDLDFGGAFASRVGEHIEIAEQCLAIGRDRHGATALPAAAGVLRSIESLNKVQVEFVGPRLQRDVVGEVPLTAGAVEDGILGPPNVLDCTLHSAAA